MVYCVFSSLQVSCLTNTKIAASHVKANPCKIYLNMGEYSERLNKMGDRYQRRVFRSYFGTSPEGAREVAERVLLSGRVKEGQLTSKRLFMGLNLIKVYCTQNVHTGIFQVNTKATHNAWVVLDKIAKLLPGFVTWPLAEDDEDSVGDFEENPEEFDLDDDYEFISFPLDDVEGLEEYGEGPEMDGEGLCDPAAQQVSGDDDDDDDDADWVQVEAEDIKETFFLSVDGVHFRINEPMDPDFRKNPKYYLHKFKQAGYTVEVSDSL